MTSTATRHIPRRTCVVCRQVRPKPELLRIARLQGGEPAFDPRARYGGRGTYVCANENCITLLHKRKGLDRAFRRAFPAAVYQKIIQEMLDYVATKDH